MELSDPSDPSDPSIERLANGLVAGQQHALGVDLIGSYLFGSVATGDFESGISDVDSVAVLRKELTEGQLAGLERLHRDIVDEMPGWDDRVEVVYLSAEALEMFRTTTSPAARISPGETFHPIQVDHRWLIDWYQLREVGIPLYGPAIEELVPVISHDEYVEAVRQHVLAWREWVGELPTQSSQAYAVLTMCRGLRTWRTGGLVSKREAARWASEELPEHAELIRAAVIWRDGSHTPPSVDGTVTRDATLRFLIDVAGLVE